MIKYNVKMIKVQAIYHPLYDDTEKFIILITGGRGSGKSFNASTFIGRLTFEMAEAGKVAHYTNAPVDAWNHCVAPIRYYTLGHILGRVLRPSL